MLGYNVVIFFGGEGIESLCRTRNRCSRKRGPTLLTFVLAIALTWLGSFFSLQI